MTGAGVQVPGKPSPPNLTASLMENGEAAPSDGDPADARLDDSRRPNALLSALRRCGRSCHPRRLQGSRHLKPPSSMPGGSAATSTSSSCRRTPSNGSSSRCWTSWVEPPYVQRCGCAVRWRPIVPRDARASDALLPGPLRHGRQHLRRSTANRHDDRPVGRTPPDHRHWPNVKGLKPVGEERIRSTDGPRHSELRRFARNMTKAVHGQLRPPDIHRSRGT